MKPQKLVLTHQIVWHGTREDLIEEIAGEFDGLIHDGSDLDVV